MGDEDVCMGCGSLIDPTTCGCGDAITHAYDGHGPIPMGCDCLRHGEQAAEQLRVARMFRDKAALAERKRIIALLRERLGEDDDASAACLRISDLADELEAQP
jgi:hypothetical protein